MSDGQPRGCLSMILSLLGLGGRPAPKEREVPYRLRDDFLSAAELSFYRVLLRAVADRAVVCAKVNLADILFVPKSAGATADRNRIDRKHVDFLLCDPHSMRPLAGVELDDKSHCRPDRVERDRLVDRAFAAAGLPLIRVPARASYDIQTVAAEIAASLESLPPQLGAVSNPPSSVPNCPKCGVPMVERRATRGPQRGRSFWGCPNYPRCHQTA